MIARTTIEDCLAMSEDGDWYAFPKDIPRRRVMAALAADGDWLDTLRSFTIRAGHVVEDALGWWHEVPAGVVTPNGATPCWIAIRRPPGSVRRQP